MNRSWEEVILGGGAVLLGLVLLVLAVRETLFVRGLWRESAEDGGRRNGLWRALFVRDWMIVICCSWLLTAFTVRFFWGPQIWIPPVNIIVIILLLLGPTIVGIQLRRLRDD